jgi:hypothetical protein
MSTKSKPAFLSLVLLIAALPISAQTIYVPGGTAGIGTSSNGNVGVGTSTPIDRLEVSNPGQVRVVLRPVSGANNRESLVDFWSTFDNYPGDTTARRVARIQAGFEGGVWGTEFLAIGVGGAGDAANPPAEWMRITASGNVGIGTTTPSASIDIWKAYSAGTDSLRLSYNDGTAYWMGIQPYVVGGGNVGYKFRTNNGNLTSDSFAITGAGNVGIGTLNPTQKLSVNGTVRAKEVIVDTGWSDYVFAEDYRLAPLEEVEAHIREKKHLPGIPTAQEVSEQGVSLGDMQARLLAKIEELTLHMIELKKENTALQQKVETLEQLARP